MASDDVGVALDGHVAVVELRRPPNNFLDVDLIANLASALEALDHEPQCRSIVLAAAGKHFCAGGNLKQRLETESRGERFAPVARHIYQEARRLVQTRKPIVAAVHGSAIGAGLGLAVVADFRVTCKESRFAANFTSIGFAPGFGLTYTLPRLIGEQRAQWMFLTGRRIKGDEACDMGLADRLVDQENVRAVAHEMAAEIARAAPLAVQATRDMSRVEYIAAFRAATERESFAQNLLRESNDYREGVQAGFDRRDPVFNGT